MIELKDGPTLKQRGLLVNGLVKYGLTLCEEFLQANLSLLVFEFTQPLYISHYTGLYVGKLMVAS